MCRYTDWLTELTIGETLARLLLRRALSVLFRHMAARQARRMVRAFAVIRCD
jgi:hypothetical protein